VNYPGSKTCLHLDFEDWQPYLMNTSTEPGAHYLTRMLPPVNRKILFYFSAHETQSQPSLTSEKILDPASQLKDGYNCTDTAIKPIKYDLRKLS
jgi:hypothetical protein